MADQSITCPSCGKKIPLSRALRAEIEDAMKAEFERRLDDERERVEKDAAKKAEKRIALEMAASQELLKEQAQELEEARRNEVVMRRRERELEKRQADLEVTIERTLAGERTKLVEETQQRVAEEHRLKDAEKERQLTDMRKMQPI